MSYCDWSSSSRWISYERSPTVSVEAAMTRFNQTPRGYRRTGACSGARTSGDELRGELDELALLRRDAVQRQVREPRVAPLVDLVAPRAGVVAEDERVLHVLLPHRLRRRLEVARQREVLRERAAERHVRPPFAREAPRLF